jgi:hypothetical protein
MPLTRVSGRTWGLCVRRPPRTTPAGLPAGASHINSWRKSAALKAAADRYVVTLNKVSIDAYGLVEVSVAPVEISVPAWA